MFFFEINVGVEKFGNADEDEDFDNGACDTSAEDDEDDAGATTTVSDDFSVGDSFKFGKDADSDSSALVGAGHLSHSSSISAKISSDVEGVDEDDVDEDDEDEDAAFATAVGSFKLEEVLIHISSSSKRADADFFSVLLSVIILLSGFGDVTSLDMLDGAEDDVEMDGEGDVEGAVTSDTARCLIACSRMLSKTLGAKFLYFNKCRRGCCCKRKTPCPNENGESSELLIAIASYCVSPSSIK